MFVLQLRTYFHRCIHRIRLFWGSSEMESPRESPASTVDENKEGIPTLEQAAPRWRRFFGGRSDENADNKETYRARSTLGILSDKQTDEVPGKLEWIPLNQTSRITLIGDC